MTIVFLLLAASGTSGQSCLVDIDCQGGLMCEAQVCVPMRQQAAPAQAPAPYVPQMVLPPPRLQTRPNGGLLPPNAHLEERPRTGLIIGGAVTLGAVWVLTWTFTTASCYNCKNGMVASSFVPVVGPFLQAAIQGNQGSAFFVLDGLVQSVGLGLIIAGAVLHKEVLVYDVGPIHAQMTPTANAHGGGFSVQGAF